MLHPKDVATKINHVWQGRIKVYQFGHCRRNDLKTTSRQVETPDGWKRKTKIRCQTCGKTWEE